MSATIVAWVQASVSGPSPKKFVLREIADTANDDGWAFGETQARLSAKVALTDRQVRFWINLLQREGLLRVVRQVNAMGVREANVYQVLAPTVDREGMPASIEFGRLPRADLIAMHKQLLAKEQAMLLSGELPDRREP